MWLYSGTGFIIGIPARDIGADEYGMMSKDDQETVKSCGLYKLQRGVKAPKEQ